MVGSRGKVASDLEYGVGFPFVFSILLLVKTWLQYCRKKVVIK